MKKLFLIPLVILTACVLWAAPSQNTASVFAYFSFPAPPPDFSNYTIYYGTSSSNYTVSVSTGSATNVTINGLTRNTTYYFNVTQRTTNNIESDYTTEVSITTPNKPPKGNGLTVIGQ